jgi:eukaryotic-like serine/threonine-protein kinase
MTRPGAVLDVMEIFNEALDQPSPSARGAYLDRACESDLRLRARVETLLAAHDRAEGFLESPAQEATIDVALHALIEGPGTVIGPYKLMEQIGEGGMGVVYVAEQTAPVRRKVALKIIKPGMDTKQVIARFEAERQALAMMDHPNIAKVFDAGATESGRPYFVMELVRGIPITDYCDREQLSIPERLDLFVLVCRAVQHAHQKGIIHRDLKPSNILVTVIDGAAVPKIIDFGVAKATGAALTERTLYTGFHQFIGTPLYMSPEQADLAGMDMDTRSDIYSLGVLLYELLTGTTPFDQETFRSAAFDEMRRIIREEEPPRPSTRLSTLGAMRTTISDNRKAEARHLDRTVRGELDWIVMKALEKDRRRRYETANDFAADVMRYLTDKPVEACPPSARYRFTKFMRRNRAGLTTSALVAMALVAGMALSLWQAARARRSAIEARERADESKQVVEYLAKDVFGGAAVGKQQSRSVTVGELLDRSDAKLSERFRRQPLVEASVRMALAESYETLMEVGRAEQNAARAVQIRERYLGPEHPITLEALGMQAWILCLAGWDRKEDLHKTQAAEPIARRVLASRRRVLGSIHPDTLLIHGRLALTVSNLGRQDEAEDLATRAEELAVRHLGPDHDSTLEVQHFLGLIAQRQGDLARAEALLRHVKESRERGHGALAHGTLSSLQDLAYTVRLEGRIDEARMLQLETVNRFAQAYGLCHIQTSPQIGDLLSLLKEQRNYFAIRDLCEGWLRDVLASPLELDKYELDRRSVRLQHLLLTLATLPEPVSFDAELAVRATEHAIAVHQGWYGWTILGALLYRPGEFEKALQALRTSIQQRDWKGGNDLHWYVMASIHARLGKWDQARACYGRGRAPETKRDSLSEIDHFRAQAMVLLGVQMPEGETKPRSDSEPVRQLK